MDCLRAARLRTGTAINVTIALPVRDRVSRRRSTLPGFGPGVVTAVYADGRVRADFSGRGRLYDIVLLRPWEIELA